MLCARAVPPLDASAVTQYPSSTERLYLQQFTAVCTWIAELPLPAPVRVLHPPPFIPVVSLPPPTPRVIQLKRALMCLLHTLSSCAPSVFLVRSAAIACSSVSAGPPSPSLSSCSCRRVGLSDTPPAHTNHVWEKLTVCHIKQPVAVNRLLVYPTLWRLHKICRLLSILHP